MVMNKVEEKVVIEERESKTFLDIPEEIRAERLDNLRTRDLKDALPSDVWNDIMKIYFGKNQEADVEKRVFDYISKNSEISPEVANRPSDAGPFQLIYRFKKPDTPIDEYYVRSRSATAIHLRMVALEDNLPGIIRREIKRQNLGTEEKFIILDVGSGSGDAIRKALRKSHHKDLLDKVEVHCVDPDKRSVERGERLAHRDGLGKVITFFNQTMAKYVITGNSKPANLILVIGLLCPATIKRCEKTLSGLYDCSASNGTIIYSTVQEEMIWGDPFLDLFMRVLGWHMHFKTDEEAHLIGTSAGWETTDYFDDLLGYNRMTVGYKWHP